MSALASIGPLTTREFTHESFLTPIPSNINGHPIFPPHNADIPCGSLRIINIHVSAEGLPNTKYFSKTDPVCTFSIQTNLGYQEYGRTEVCWNMLDPLWIRPFTYRVKDTPELLLFSIYDVITNAIAMNQQKFLGAVEIDPISLLNSPTHSLDIPIQPPENAAPKGVFHINYFEIMPCQGALFLTFKGTNLGGPGLKKINPFFVIQRLSPHSNKFVSVYKSEVKLKKRETEWDNVELGIQYLCGGDMSTIIRINLYDYRQRDIDGLVGFFDTTVESILYDKISNFQFTSPHGGKVGNLKVILLNHWTGPRLFDYRLRGVQLGAMIAIDFSATNVDAIITNRVQHLDEGLFSYKAAINDTCDLLYPLTMGEPYIAYGFADFGNSKKLISLSLDKIDNRGLIPNAKTLIQLYTNAKTKITYPKKCYIAPVINEAAIAAQHRWDTERTISVLVILTNGRFADLKEGVDEMVNAEMSPLVIIMVAMGGTRRELDNIFKGKKGILTDSFGRRTQRRILTLVSYSTDRRPNERLPNKIAPSAKKMAREYLEMINFYQEIETNANGPISPISRPFSPQKPPPHIERPRTPPLSRKSSRRGRNQPGSLPMSHSQSIISEKEVIDENFIIFLDS
ncbi:hypothetical protein TRFO_24228 [Tritrichomonas foetus]|uniref:C2 domain-containing protein n=1 Tax=Tritrichomonas foetus TaxID=1144522 RepID=A0A1J4KDF5_9EUKA|nr:hypothetical protein TRFO_24228 [Tritrichomonas foetus]|eukprot:OHT07493.1 hypothetical protein TRFO_24228 [Tritrichomonas foetus]